MFHSFGLFRNDRTPNFGTLLSPVSTEMTTVITKANIIQWQIYENLPKLLVRHSVVYSLSGFLTVSRKTDTGEEIYYYARMVVKVSFMRGILWREGRMASVSLQSEHRSLEYTAHRAPFDTG